MIVKRYKRALFLLVFSVFLIIAFCLIADKSQIVLSVPSGFYDDEFELTIKNIPIGKEIEVHYTLNGNDPTVDDPVYQGPITVKDATSDPNLYANITDVSPALEPEKLEGFSGEYYYPEYAVPDYNVDKCTVIKAACFDKGETVGEVITGTYFVGFSSKRGYENISIMSLTVNYDDFFGYENGIYVTGKLFDDYLANDYPGYFPIWQFRPANYNCRGKKYEVPVIVDFFDEQHEYLWSGKVGARINGNASRSFVPKSLALYARKEYGNFSAFGYDFWETGYNPDEIILFSGSSDYNTRLNDPIAAEIANGLDVAAMHFTPCQLFVNGEYWGLYFITEKFNQSYFDYYYKLKGNKITLVKDNQVVEGNANEITAFNNMIEFISDNDMSEKRNYEKACELIDVDQLASYLAVQTFIARTGDWPEYNFGWWRVSEKEDNEFADTRWRCFVFDENNTVMEEEFYLLNSIEVIRRSPICDSLLKNGQFEELYKSKVCILCRLFSPERMRDILDGYSVLLEDAIAVHNRRFFGDEDYADSMYVYSGPEITSRTQAVEGVYSFFDKRGDYLLSLMNEPQYGE